MHQSMLLVVNAATLLSRMVLTFGVGLFVTRLLLDLVGPSDFGLLAALGASGMLLVLVTPALNAGTIRNLAYELGRSDPRRASEVFNATLALFAGMGLVMLLAGLLAEGPLLGGLTIPAGREPAAAAVFRLTLASVVVTTLSAPFRGAIEARQAMGLVASGEVLRSLLNLGCVGLLFIVEGDRLVVYSAGLLASTLLRAIGTAAIGAIRFPEMRIRPSAIRLAELRRVASFTGWTALIRMGAPLHAQAALVLIGMAFSPVVTAAYGIAMRVRDYHAHLAWVLPRVVHPAMSTREARGERGYVQDLAFMTSKYASLGSLFLVVPLLIETEGILGLWLREVPPGAAAATRLALLWMTIEVLATGVDQAVLARGAVRGYGLLTFGVRTVSVVASAFAFFGLGLGPLALLWIYLASALVHLAVTLGVGATRAGLSASRWWREALVPVAAPALPGALAALAVHACMPATLLGILAIVAAYALVAAPLSWWWSVGPKEKRVFARAWERVRARGGALRDAGGNSARN